MNTTYYKIKKIRKRDGAWEYEKEYKEFLALHPVDLKWLSVYEVVEYISKHKFDTDRFTWLVVKLTEEEVGAINNGNIVRREQ